jgi:hypothetical protein
MVDEVGEARVAEEIEVGEAVLSNDRLIRHR